LHDLELDVFSLFQGLESFSLQRGIMYEDIIPALKANEPESLAVVEPFYRTFCFHKTLLSSTTTPSCVAGPGTQLATYMMRRNKQEEEQVGMTGSLERQNRSRNPSRYNSRSMYHGVSNLVKPFFSRMLAGREVDKPRPLTYSVASG
jgi:hypothetical protein